MHNSKLVEILNATDDLLEELASLGLLQFLLLDDVVEKLTSADKLHDQEELFRGLDDFKELDDIGVPDKLQNIDFSGDALDISIAGDLTLLQYFDGYLYTLQFKY